MSPLSPCRPTECSSNLLWTGPDHVTCYLTCSHLSLTRNSNRSIRGARNKKRVSPDPSPPARVIGQLISQLYCYSHASWWLWRRQQYCLGNWIRFVTRATECTAAPPTGKRKREKLTKAHLAKICLIAGRQSEYAQ